MPDQLDIFAGAILNVLFGITAYWKKSVRGGGCITGMLVGIVIYITGGFNLWCILGAFFLSSTILSRFGKSNKAFLKNVHEKLDCRDSCQVLANSGIASICSILLFLSGDMMFMVGFLVALAASTADTWASEIGVLSKNDPVSIIGFHRVPKGTSGGMSMLGSVVSLAGALFIPLLHWLIWQITASSSIPDYMPFMIALIVSGGFLGSLTDSILGATLQVQYRCTATGHITEKKYNHDRPTIQIAGLRAINNDMVNFISNGIAVAAALSVYYVFIVR